MKTVKSILTTFVIATLYACSDGGGGGSSALPTTTTLPPGPITITGNIMDGPVTGGRLYVFELSAVNDALAAADSAEDRVAALDGAGALVSMVRPDEDGDTYALEVSGDLANTAVFLVFDGTDSNDEAFADNSLGMESVLVLGAENATYVAHISPQSSMITTQVRSLAGSSSDVANEIITANNNVIAAVGSDEFGNTLLADGSDIIGTDDPASLFDVSIYVGGLVRSAAAVSGLSERSVLLAMGADSADGVLDGSVPSALDVIEGLDETAEEVSDFVTAGRLDFEITGGSCSMAANVLMKACELDFMDDYLEGQGVCQNTDDMEEFTECMADVSDEGEELAEECDAVHEARLELCEAIDDAPHVPEFGEDFADNFVDPLEIGGSVPVNPWLPLVVGNTWVLAGTFLEDEDDIEEGEIPELITEVITVVVTDKVKMIEGIPCIVVNDVVEVDGELIEDTDDWFAQDVEGNVWYCGEIAENFESFEGDDPGEAELVDIEGSWKHGRDTAEAGILMPFAPVVGDIFRSEVLYGEAEDALEILSLEGDETTPGASCDGMCLVTRDFSPLSPDELENKYYVSGIGNILEIEPDSGNRVELQSFTPGSP